MSINRWMDKRDIVHIPHGILLDHWKQWNNAICNMNGPENYHTKEINPGTLLEGMMQKVKLQYLGHLMWRVDSLERTLRLGGIGGRRRRRRSRMRWLDDITDSMDVSLSELGRWWWTGRPGVPRFMGLQRVRHDWATELNWTEYMPCRTGFNSPDSFTDAKTDDQKF